MTEPARSRTVPAVGESEGSALRTRIAVVVCVLSIGVALVPARAGAVASVGVSGGNGFDTCTAPSLFDMQQWWPNTPWGDVNIYFAGINRACGQPELTASWVNQVLAIGYDIIPTYVGRQAPCSGIGVTMSWDPATANQQGANAAVGAVRAARALGIYAPAIVYADIEAYNTADGACVAAVNSWVDGWVGRLHAKGFSAGVYGSSCGSNVAGWATLAHVPDDVWIAQWNGVPSVWGMTCVSDGLWPYRQRIHQFLGGHDETWNGVTLNIDNDCEYGLLVGVDHELDDDGWCTYWGPGRSAVTDVRAAPRAVWATGRGSVMRRADGSLWLDVSPQAGSMAGSAFLDASTGWVASAADGTGRARVFRTGDGGATWQMSELPLRYPSGYGAVHMDLVDHRTGWLTVEKPHGPAFAAADLYRTTDGGVSWTWLGAGSFAGDIRFSDLRHGWVVGDAGGGSLYATTDGGATWHRRSLPGAEGAAGLAVTVGLPTFFGSRGVVAATVHGRDSTRVVLLSSDDAGLTWSGAGTLLDTGLRRYGAGAALPFVALDRDRWISATGDGLATTADGGRTWRSLRSAALSGVTELRFTDVLHGWAIVSGGGCTGFKSGCSAWSTLLETRDGGATWTPAYTNGQPASPAS